MVRQVLAEGHGFWFDAERIQEWADRLVQDCRLDKELNATVIPVRLSHALDRAEVELCIEECDADGQTVNGVACRLDEVACRACDRAEIDSEVAVGALPDQCDESALHQPLARHVVPEFDANTRLAGARTSGRAI